MEDAIREAYDNTWSLRRNAPIVLGSWTDNDWAKGRTDYLTFLIRVTDDQIHKKVSKLQDQLTSHKCLSQWPSSYLHVTVKETACFLTENEPAEDELSHSQLDKLKKAAEKALKGMNPFHIEFNRVNHFRSNIIIEAHDDGSVREMNRRLLGLEETRVLQYDYPKFLPHMSISYFNCDENHDELVTALESFRDIHIGKIDVTSIDLVKAVLPMDDSAPVLEVIESHELG